MKKIILTIALVISWILSFSQIDNNVGKYFEFTQNVSIQKCDGIGNLVTPATSEIINVGIQFRIDGTALGGYVIHILQKGSDVTFNSKLFMSNYTVTTKNRLPNIFFVLPIETFNTKCKSRLTKNSFTVGTIILPIKMRFGSGNKIDNIYSKDFLVTSDVSLGISMGYKHKWNSDWGINFLGGFNLTMVQVDSSTTKGYYKSASNASGVTWHLGSLLEYNSFQFGVFTGIDYLSGGVGKKWIYKDNCWLGIAIGYSIFKTKSGNDSQ
jgi:hypothetical protein